MDERQTVVCVAKLHANQLERHLELFEYVPSVERVVLVRHQPLPTRLSKLENRAFGGRTRAEQAFRMAREVRKVVRQTGAEWVLGFNPVPWGTIGALSSALCGRKLCLSLIGMDFLQVQKWFGAPFLRAVKRADAVTVTGDKMQRRLTELGVASDKIHILPHSVDTDRFRPRNEPIRWDLLCVGQLIERKRIGDLISALALIKGEHPRIRLGILGRGPLEGELRRQVSVLGLEHNVEFLGYRNDVEAILAGARMFCLVSQWEGVPFALMEAMASGLVPVVTDVGTISDWVKDGQNGRIVPVAEPRHLANTLKVLLDPSNGRLAQLQKGLLEERERLGFASGAAVWKRILQPR